MGASKIALGHHADDLAETALMNLFWHGQFSTMAPVVSMMGGAFTLVRPLIYVGKDSIARWRRAQGDDFLSSSCREEGTRAFARGVLEQVYRRNRAARKNLLRCLLDERGPRGKTE
jgi:tRNA 2-thiocytidine biosynthesis protein TtcA